ncbi:MAG: DNA/RNA non-specific endonuclease [Flavobacteriaceae bacterium]
MKRLTQIFAFVSLLFFSCSQAQDSIRISNLSSQTKKIVEQEGYNHNEWQTLPIDLKYEFAAYISSFDSDDPINNNKDSIALGIPEWVSFEIHKIEGEKLKCKRPTPWLTDKVLHEKGIVPSDDTYKVAGTKKLSVVSGDYRYVRGHVCPFDAAARISCDAAWNTCITLNAVPQLQWQNNGIWKKLEKNTTDWADKHEKVWVIAGPVFFDNNPSVWLGQQGEVKAAVPDALFKIIIRKADTETGIETISFIIPNVIPKSKELHEYVTNIKQIEELTELTFLNKLSKELQEKEKAKHGMPSLPDNYSSLSSSEKRKAKDELKKEFYQTNKDLINSWF